MKGNCSRNSSGVLHGPFVVGIHLRPKSRLSCIKSNEDMGRLDALQEMAQHEVKAIDRIGMQTIGILKRSI